MKDAHELLVHAVRQGDEKIFFGTLQLPTDTNRWETTCVLVSLDGETTTFVLDLVSEEVGEPPTGSFAQQCWIWRNKLVISAVQYILPPLKEAEGVRGAKHQLSSTFMKQPPRWKALHPRAGQFARESFHIWIRRQDEVRECFLTKGLETIQTGWTAFRAKNPSFDFTPYHQFMQLQPELSDAAMCQHAAQSSQKDWINSHTPRPDTIPN